MPQPNYITTKSAVLSVTRKAAGLHGTSKKSKRKLQDNTKSDLGSVLRKILGSLLLSTKALITIAITKKKPCQALNNLINTNKDQVRRYS
jgi:hypothetical protein